ncbi:MAG: ABC transporter permease [Stellaceae bacterium]
MTIREIESFFRGSMLGKVWAVVVPLFMLGMYTLVFGVVLHVHWPGRPRNEWEMALIYFAGLVLSAFFVESVTRAPTLLFQYSSFVKKVVFPLEIMPLVLVGGAFFRAAIGACVLGVYYLLLEGLPPLAAITIPLSIVPLAFATLGLAWVFTAIGIYIRDLRHVMLIIMPSMMFLAPIFFPLSAVPPSVRPIFLLNPLTFPVETIRGALFFGIWPDWLGLAIYTVVSLLLARLGFAIFQKLRPGFADLI